MNNLLNSPYGSLVTDNMFCPQYANCLVFVYLYVAYNMVLFEGAAKGTSSYFEVLSLAVSNLQSDLQKHCTGNIPDNNF